MTSGLQYARSLLRVNRRFHHGDDSRSDTFPCERDHYVRAGEWKRFEPGVWDGTLLRGRTLGSVGYGARRRRVAQRARAFGMRILYTRRTVSADQEYRTLDALLAESDFVSLHTPLTAETQHLLNAERLARMKRGAWLINMARGAVVDEEALVQVLRSGHLAGAALDVFEREPEVHSALLTMDNVVLAPHMGGCTQESRRAARLTCFEMSHRCCVANARQRRSTSSDALPHCGNRAPRPERVNL